jgi:hypothetical protein
MVQKVDKWIYLIILILAIPAALYLIKPGFYDPHDTHHIVDIYEMSRAISSSQIPPRLSPDMTFGFGYPLFNYYYVMPFYLASLLFFITNSLVFSLKAVFFMTIFISVIGMYLFMREFVGRAASVTAALIYLYTPYRAVQIYVRGAIGEAVIMAVLPFVFYILIKYLKKPTLTNFCSAAIILAIFILSHNYLWAFSLIVFGILLIVLYFDNKNFWKKIVQLIKVGILSLGISFYWWGPAILEQHLVAKSTPFALIDHFPFIKQLIIPSWGYGASVWGSGDGLSFQIGIVNLLVSVIFGILFILNYKKIKKPEIRLGVWALGGFFATIFMMNIRSYFIWQHVPFINFIQFPWRLLFLEVVFTSVMAGLVIELAPKRNQLILGALVILLAIDLTNGYFAGNFRFFKTDQDYLNRFLHSENYSEDYLQLPNWTSERPKGTADNFVWGLSVDNYSNEVYRLVVHNLKINMNQDGMVNLALYYFPGWFGEVDGQKIKLVPGYPYGQISFELSQGQHDVKIWWGETKLRLAADLISFVSILILFLIYKGKVKLDRI